MILVVQCKNHDQFERKDDDLFMRKKISLNEALCGYSTVVKHLDGRHLVLSTSKGVVIKPESIQMVAGEGMPIPNNMEKGNLYIIFEVEFPNNHFLNENEYKVGAFLFYDLHFILATRNPSSTSTQSPTTNLFTRID